MVGAVVIEVVLVRHGEPDWEPGGRAVDDPELTELGRKQASALAQALGGLRFDSFLTSTLRRARETAAPIAETSGVEPCVHSWLSEMGIPSLEGRTVEEVEQFFKRVMTRELDRWWDGIPGGESFRHFYERVTAGIEGLLLGEHRARIHEEHPHRLWKIPEDDRRILIVAHEGSNAVILSHLLGIEPVPWAWMRFSSGFAGISRVYTKRVASGHVWVLAEFNRRHHLTGVGESGRAYTSLSDIPLDGG
jgi:broad specificity phosphatase PhoE